MKRFPWLSDTYRRLSRREKTVVLGGALVSAVALVTVYAVLPFAQHWMDREAELAVKAEQLARLETLIAQRDAIQETLVRLRDERGRAGSLLLEGETPAVAASRLLELLNRFAEESRVLLDRVDMAGEVEASGDSLVPIPAQVTARGDIYGLVDLLFYLQHGEKLLVIDDFRMNAGRAAGTAGQLVTWTIALHGYYAGARGTS
jgi:type II secretory pathway component PulM